jgi:hypothetical protein
MNRGAIVADRSSAVKGCSSPRDRSAAAASCREAAALTPCACARASFSKREIRGPSTCASRPTGNQRPGRGGVLSRRLHSTPPRETSTPARPAPAGRSAAPSRPTRALDPYRHLVSGSARGGGRQWCRGAHASLRPPRSAEGLIRRRPVQRAPAHRAHQERALPVPPPTNNEWTFPPVLERVLAGMDRPLPPRPIETHARRRRSHTSASGGPASWTGIRAARLVRSRLSYNVAVAANPRANRSFRSGARWEALRATTSTRYHGGGHRRRRHAAPSPAPPSKPFTYALLAFEAGVHPRRPSCPDLPAHFPTSRARRSLYRPAELRRRLPAGPLRRARAASARIRETCPTRPGSSVPHA